MVRRDLRRDQWCEISPLELFVEPDKLPLAPVWVWLAFSEAPSRATLAGGLIVAVAVVADILAAKPKA